MSRRVIFREGAPSNYQKEVRPAMQTVQSDGSRPAILLERLIRENQVSLKRLCYLYLHDEALAEDAVQETFLKVYRSLGAFRGDASEKTYLTRIAVNTCKDMLRSAWLRRVDRRVTVEMLPDQSAVRDPRNSQIAAAVMNLPGTGGAHDPTDEKSRRHYRGTQGRRSDGMGAEDEQRS